MVYTTATTSKDWEAIMKTYDWKRMSVAEIGAVIRSHLERHHIEVVLSGGACVTIYADNRYRSNDFDFVMGDTSLQTLDPLMEELGFHRTTSLRHYEHPDCLS